MTTGHILITMPDRAEAATQRLRKMGITPHVMPAIVPPDLAPGWQPYLRFGGATRPRTAKEHGIALSHIAALGMARTMGWEWAGFWEDDVDGVPDLGWQDLDLPADCGVLYLGGALWWPREAYGEPLGGNLWRVTKPLPISTTHAFMVHRRAMGDLMDAYTEMTMTLDDLLSCACIAAQREGRWSTCFLSPWLAWQRDRRETWRDDTAPNA
jgi:hypothetical protein